ncbi:MAG TPA: glycosyltransferase family protein [Chitinophagaceae bacterium]
MKIFYAIQATGNGHISRAMELLPHLQQFGEVDLFLSGANSTLTLDVPIKYRSQGLSLFYTCNGGLNYSRTLRQLSLSRIRKEIRDLPVDKYDLIINDFDCITSLACSRKKIASINFGHQASFISAKTPRPAKVSRTGEWILRNYAKATHYTGLHFEQYDDFILTPVIKKDIFEAEPTDKGYITVYLPSYCKPELLQYFSPLKDHRFQIFTWQVESPQEHGNITFLPVSYQGFNESMIHCSALICGAGFETPAEALHLGKKMMVIPIKGQYEQCCNAAALERLGVKSIAGLDINFRSTFNQWIQTDKHQRVEYKLSSASIVEIVMKTCTEHMEITTDKNFSIDELVNVGL